MTSNRRVLVLVGIAVVVGVLRTSATVFAAPTITQVVSAQVLNQDPRRGVTLIGFGNTTGGLLPVGLKIQGAAQSYVVPAGQRLVVESLSADCTTNSGEEINMRFDDVFPDSTTLIIYPLYASVQSFDLGTHDRHTVLTPFRAYVDAGHSIRLFANRFSSGTEVICFAVVNGFTVDMP